MVKVTGVGEEKLDRRGKVSDHSEAEWQSIIYEFETSGLSQKKFCQQIGMVHSTFRRWYTRLKKVGLEDQGQKYKKPQPMNTVANLGFGVNGLYTNQAALDKFHRKAEEEKEYRLSRELKEIDLL